MRHADTGFMSKSHGLMKFPSKCPKCPQSPTSATLLCCQIIIELIAKYPQHGTWSPSLNCNLAMEPPECCDIASGGGIKKRHRCLLLNVISGELVVTAVINLRMCRRDQICLSNTPVLSRVNLIWLVAHVVKSVQEKMLIPSWNYDS